VRDFNARAGNVQTEKNIGRREKNRNGIKLIRVGSLQKTKNYEYHVKKHRDSHKHTRGQRSVTGYTVQ
jgi:hypothetical protein